MSRETEAVFVLTAARPNVSSAQRCYNLSAARRMITEHKTLRAYGALIFPIAVLRTFRPVTEDDSDRKTPTAALNPRKGTEQTNQTPNPAPLYWARLIIHIMSRSPARIHLGRPLLSASSRMPGPQRQLSGSFVDRGRLRGVYGCHALSTSRIIHRVRSTLTT